jgi:hypothetical protein
MFIAKKTPGSIGDFVWDTPGAVVDVDAQVAAVVLAANPGEYSEADAPKGKQAKPASAVQADAPDAA